MRRRTVREVEIKLRVRDLAALIGRLRALGARCGGRVFERNVLYDTPESDLRRGGRLLRLRVEAPARSKWLPGGRSRSVVTSKRPAPSSEKSRYKEKLERELAVVRPERWPATLSSIGFRAGFCYEKCRTTFHWGGLHLDLDETPVGTFLELEGSPRLIDRVARRLGYSPRDYIRATYWDVFQTDCRARGRFPRNMLFRKKKSR